LPVGECVVIGLSRIGVALGRSFKPAVIESSFQNLKRRPSNDGLSRARVRLNRHFARSRLLDSSSSIERGGKTMIEQRIYFMDEAPRIGCGYRDCTVKIGRRWVRITERATGKRARFSLKEYALLTGEARQPLRRVKPK